MVSTLNITTALQILFELRVEAIDSGEIKLGYGNQFDRTMFTSAKENATELNVQSVLDSLAGLVDRELSLDALPLYQWAFRLSTYKAPEMSTAWTD
jgi:hypothetical protein